MTELIIRGVRKAYGATLALKRGDLDLKSGEVHVLIGSNGSGKSTLCKIVAGSVRPDEGEVVLNGQPVTVSGPRAARALGIGIFYQELSLSAHRSVAENISLADLPRKAGILVDRRSVEERAEKYISLFKGVTGDDFSADAPVNSLREDQRQLVEIMKTLASEAAILIFDEPTSSLDRSQAERFFEVLRELKAQGRAIVFISHRMDEIFAIGDRVTVIRDGETIATTHISSIDQAGIVSQMVGEAPGMQAGKAPVDALAAIRGKTTLTASQISGKHFHNISFEVSAGEILGLGGLHGQGQSAVLRALFGASQINAGTVTLNGRTITVSSPRQAIRQGFAYVSGDRVRDGVITGRPIIENLSPVHFLRERMHLVRPANLKEKILPALQAMQTRFASLSHPISSLSGGNQQKIVIGRWLIDRQQVLLLDDPTKGIDLSAKADLFALIRKLASDGMSIILYSSEDSELLDNADRILVFNGGAVTRELTGGERTRFNLYRAAYEAA
ncbi:sugar ABC transporter ATP-binding protein [Brucella thiophenivorans]|uniref:Heme ABC exporter, ATP-binding protein CcmA n=1 Tax=Brucella thiophenivorans TaxID=571255 RepID=A0A256FWG3_9HYPH|nr:sugar ABC transporter ATP-binding protein [Brucella thiophenivorans]OYR19179.1 heme ABC exporter, ATP-binding protein CcmA [Brucella thiophenivorans]